MLAPGRRLHARGRWLDDGETLTYLHSCVSTRRQRVRVPETPMYLDALLADEPLTGGLEPRLGARICARSPSSAFPSQTWPGCSTSSTAWPSPIAGSTRAICLDKTDATKLLTKIRRQWFAKRKSIIAILKEVMTNEASVLVDTDAANKALDADAALRSSAPISSARPMSPRRSRSGTRMRGVADEKLRLVEKIIQGRDFTCMRETVNAVEAWLGSLAGPCLRQCPPAADLDAQPRPHDAALGGLGGAGTGRAFRGAAAALRAGPKARRRSASRSMSAMSATRWSSARPAPASRCCWR